MSLLAPAAHAHPDNPAPVNPSSNGSRHAASVLHNASCNPDRIGHITLAARTRLGDDLNAPESIKRGLGVYGCAGCEHGNNPHDRGTQM